MRKPAVKSFAGWRSITACTNTSPRTQRSADGSSRANPFPAEAFRRQIGKLRNDRTLFLRIVSADLYTLYVEGNVYLRGAWHRIFL